MSPKSIAAAGILLCELVAGCRATEEISGPQWKPIGNRKAKAVLWGIVHNHARGKFDALRRLTNDYEVVGWVDDSKSTAMRMQEPRPNTYTNWPCIDGAKVLNHEIPCDVVVVECANSELVEVSTKIALAGYPMHMDKPLGVDQAGYRRMSNICERHGIPLQIGYMFRANEAINKMVELAHDGVLGEVFAIDADLNHCYGYPKYPEYASHYPGGTAYLLTCHAIEWAMPIFDDRMPDRTYSIVKPAPGDPEWAKTHAFTVMEYPRCIATFRVCSRGTQPCRHIRIDGSNGTVELKPVEDFRKVKHETGLPEDGMPKVNALSLHLYLKSDAKGYKKGYTKIEIPAPHDRYAGQLREFARILRGEIPNPPGLYKHDLLVHKVSLEACNLPTADVE